MKVISKEKVIAAVTITLFFLLLRLIFKNLFMFTFGFSDFWFIGWVITQFCLWISGIRNQEEVSLQDTLMDTFFFWPEYIYEFMADKQWPH